MCAAYMERGHMAKDHGWSRITPGGRFSGDGNETFSPKIVTPRRYFEIRCPSEHFSRGALCSAIVV